MGLGSWIIDVTGVDRRLDQSHRRGSSRGRDSETEGERDSETREREDEKKKNKKGIKNYKEIIFK